MISWLRRRSAGTRPTEARVDDLFTPFPQIVEELKRRAADETLKRNVERYIGELPAYFARGPVLYLARHVATPNFETLRFVHLMEMLDMQTVIGQDTRDRFVAHNPLKRALGKLPVCLGITQGKGSCMERYQKLTVIDFNVANGKRFEDIRTLWGEPLVEFHTVLLRRFASREVVVEDDATWIDRNHRGDLLAHYKKFLALFVAHGILFEDYLVEDKHEGQFVTDVLHPAFAHVERTFGVRPLITQLTPTSVESAEYWMSYPKEVLAIVQEKLRLAV